MLPGQPILGVGVASNVDGPQQGIVLQPVQSPMAVALIVRGARAGHLQVQIDLSHPVPGSALILRAPHLGRGPLVLPGDHRDRDEGPVTQHLPASGLVHLVAGRGVHLPCRPGEPAIVGDAQLFSLADVDGPVGPQVDRGAALGSHGLIVRQQSLLHRNLVKSARFCMQDVVRPVHGLQGFLGGRRHASQLTGGHRRVGDHLHGSRGHA